MHLIGLPRTDRAEVSNLMDAGCRKTFAEITLRHKQPAYFTDWRCILMKNPELSNQFVQHVTMTFPKSIFYQPVKRILFAVKAFCFNSGKSKN